jgi:hypothetical protein
MYQALLQLQLLEQQAYCLPTKLGLLLLLYCIPRDPEQARVAAGSEVLLALLEVLKSYAQQLEHAVQALRMCLELMLQLLGMGECTGATCGWTNGVPLLQQQQQ